MAATPRHAVSVSLHSSVTPAIPIAPRPRRRPASATVTVASEEGALVVFGAAHRGDHRARAPRDGHGYVSWYGRLRAFAEGIRPDARAAMGHTIGYLGLAELATAPQLHVEALVDGAPRDPRTALQTRAGVALRMHEHAAFRAVRERLRGPDRAAMVAVARTSMTSGG